MAVKRKSELIRDFLDLGLMVVVGGGIYWWLRFGRHLFPPRHAELLAQGWEHLGVESERVKYLEELYRLQGEETQSVTDARGRVHWYVRRGFV